MALPQFIVRDPDGKHLSTHETRHEADAAIQRDLVARGARYTVDDSAWRKQEAEEMEALAEQARYREAEALLAAEAEAAQVRQDTLAIVNNQRKDDRDGSTISLRRFSRH